MRAEVEPLAQGGALPQSGGQGMGGSMSADMLALQLAPMKEAIQRLPKLIEKMSGFLERLEEKYDTMLDRMDQVREATEASRLALQDIRDDVDHAAQEIAIRNADYARERDGQGG